MIFYVRGRGEFPFDMLRHDQCFPSTSSDAEKLADTWAYRTIEMSTDFHKITPDRWRSFGWEAREEDRDWYKD